MEAIDGVLPGTREPGPPDPDPEPSEQAGTGGRGGFQFPDLGGFAGNLGGIDFPDVGGIAGNFGGISFPNPGSGNQPGGGGTSGSTPPPSPGNGAPSAEDTLNPLHCESEKPFVLSIVPNGTSGTVSGWLQAGSSVIFEDELPRFGVHPSSATLGSGLALWWAVDSLSAGTVRFYPANAETRVAMATGASTAAQIGNAAQLSYSGTSSGPARVGDILVFRHVPEDRYLAVRVVVLNANGDQDPNCVSLESKWLWAPPGSSHFSGSAL